MGETLLLVTIITLVVLTIRRAKPVVLDSPVIIQRSGQFHITLAPQLNRAQNFIENIAAQFRLLDSPQTDSLPQYFGVHDPQVFAQGTKFYLLAVTLRDGILYFQAINPRLSTLLADAHIKELQEFSNSVLEKYPCACPSPEEVGAVSKSVETAAQQMNIVVKKLQSGI